MEDKKMFQRVLYQDFRRTVRFSLALMMVFALVAAVMPSDLALASDSSVTITAQYQADELVVLNIASTEDIPSLDPGIASDSVSIPPIENLFHGLTDYDPLTSQVVPELATSWSVTPDGLTWTFNLRDDVMWYRYDPASDTADALRAVTAQDVVFGIKRACDPRLGGYYGTIAARVIAGCNTVNQAPSNEVTDELVYGDTTKVSAPDDTTVVIELQFAAGYFFSMTPMWMLRPIHQETIDEFGDNWTEPGNITTNGPYFIKENTRGVRRIFVRNSNHNPELDYGGNIDVIEVRIIEDGGTIFSLYLDEQLDVSGVPGADLQNILGDPNYQNQLLQTFTLGVFYFGFAFDKAPFDNVHARRAFSAILDRAAFVEQVEQGLGVPMIHFTPPGMAHAPPINEVGVGFDPEYAVAQLAEAGYPNCEGFPNVDIVTWSGGDTWTEYWAAAAEEHLGCDPDLFTVEQLAFEVMLELISADTPTQDRPNAWTLGWLPDYGDANNWVGDVLACNSDNAFLRPCSEIDDLIEAAARESDPAIRTQLYRDIEEAFFGLNGEYPIAPIFMQVSFSLIKPWYTGPFETDGIFGGAHWDTRNIDMSAKLAARGGN
jgi:oligopeptide transport system substrate-binding protein